MVTMLGSTMVNGWTAWTKGDMERWWQLLKHVPLGSETTLEESQSGAVRERRE